MSQPWIPCPMVEDKGWINGAEWQARLQKIRSQKEGFKPSTVFLGDSLTEEWLGPGLNPWKEYWAPFSIPMGIGGDRTQHLLWRLQNGELQGVEPKVLVVNIGINNLWSGPDTPEEVVKGIKAVVEECQKQSPFSHIFVQTLFPAMEPGEPLREKVIKTNTLLKKEILSKQKITLFTLWDLFLNSDQSLNRSLVHDGVHLTESGYRLWSKELYPHIEAHIR